MLAGSRVLDLERRCRQAETLRQDPLEPAPRSVTIRTGGHQDVRGEGREPARHRPHVKVVDLDDVLLGDERAADRSGSASARRPLEKDHRRLTKELGARPEHEPRDCEACDRIEAIPPGREDEATGERRGAECRDVRQDMEEGSADIEALAAGAREHGAGGDAHRDASECHDQRRARRAPRADRPGGGRLTR